MLLDLNGKAWDLSESWKDRHREVSNAIKPTVPRPCRDLCLARSSLPKRPEPHTKSYSAAAMSTMPWCVRPSPFNLFAIFLHLWNHLTHVVIIQFVYLVMLLCYTMLGVWRGIAKFRKPYWKINQNNFFVIWHRQLAGWKQYLASYLECIFSNTLPSFWNMWTVHIDKMVPLTLTPTFEKRYQSSMIPLLLQT